MVSFSRRTQNIPRRGRRQRAADTVRRWAADTARWWATADGTDLALAPRWPVAGDGRLQRGSGASPAKVDGGRRTTALCRLAKSRKIGVVGSKVEEEQKDEEGLPYTTLQLKQGKREN
uniref:Uncharacterized protein n=1 Tax=Oryza punctata TaxID=4537 RepID=A0A0E0MCN0_ORYPU